MPKSNKLLSQFSGGLVDALHPRDIPEDSLSIADNVQLKSSGQVELISRHGVSSSDILDMSIFKVNPAGAAKGRSLFQFTADRGLGRKVAIAAVEEEAYDDDTVRMYTLIAHGLREGLSICITGVHADFQGIHTIINVADAFSFDIASANHASAAGINPDHVATDESRTVGVFAADDGDDIIPLSALATNKPLGLIRQGSSNEIMAFIRYTNNVSGSVEMKVKRGWGGTTVAANVSATGAITETRPGLIHSSDWGGQSGFAFVQEEVTKVPKNNMYLIFDGGKIDITDGNVYLKDIGRISKQAYNSAALTTEFRANGFNHIHYNDYQIYHEDNKVDMPTQENVVGAFFEEDGIVRVSAQNFHHDVDPYYNRKIFYEEAQFFGFSDRDATSKTLNQGATIASAAYNTFSNTNNTGEQSGYAVGTSDATLYRASFDHSSNLNFQDGQTYTVSLNISKYGNDPIHDDQLKNYPVFYFAEAEHASNINFKSSVYKAKEGFNIFHFDCNDSGTGSFHRTYGSVDLASADQAVFLIMENYGKCSFKWDNLRVSEGIAGHAHGWKCTDQYLPFPYPMYANVNATHNHTMSYSGVPYMTLYTDTGPGDWMLASQNKYVRFGFSLLYDDSNQESLIHSTSHLLIEGSAQTYLDLSAGNATDTSEIKGEIRIRNGVTSITDGSGGWPTGSVGFKIYIIGHGEATTFPDLDDPLWFATIYFDRNKNSQLFDGRKLTPVEVDSETSKYTFEHVIAFPGTGYSNANGEYETVNIAPPQFGTGCVVGGHSFIGNTVELTGGYLQRKIRGDTIRKSRLRQYDAYPTTIKMEIDKDDGDYIVSMLAFELKMFVFKTKNVYIFAIEEEGERVEKTLYGLGIKNENGATITNIGIIWCNEHGLYKWDGEELTNLMRGQISDTSWKANFEEEVNIGFSQKDQSVVCVGTNCTYVYSTKYNNWVRYGLLIASSQMSNLVTTHHGVSWLTTMGGGVDTITIENTTAQVKGVKGLGGFTATGQAGTLDAGVLTVVDSAGAAKIVSSAFDALEIDLYSQMGAVNSHIIAIYSHQGNLGNPHILQSYGNEFDVNGPFFVGLHPKFYGTYMNSTASGSNAVYFGSAGDSGNFTGATHTAISGGVNPVAGVTKIHIDRNSNIDAGCLYRVTIPLKKQPWGSTNPPGTGDDTLVDTFIFEYTTVYNDGNDAVRDGLAAAMNASNDFSSKVTVDAGTSNYIQITGKEVTCGACGDIGAGKGYYQFQNAESPIEVETTGSITLPGELITWKPFSDPTSVGYLKFATKDIFNDSVGQRKKVYKVYISYRCTGESNVTVGFITDGKTDDDAGSNTKTFTGVSNYTSSTLDSTSGEWARAELKPTTSSETNNIQSIRIVFIGSGDGTMVPADFAFNDISVIYRVKNVK